MVRDRSQSLILKRDLKYWTQNLMLVQEEFNKLTKKYI